MIAKISQAAKSRVAACSHVFGSTLTDRESCLRGCGASRPAVLTPKLTPDDELPKTTPLRESWANLPKGKDEK